jgi:hypothetical protein
VLSPASVDVKDPEPGAVTTTIVDGKHRAAFGVSPLTYITSIRVTQVFVTVANTTVLDYESLFPDYRILLALSTVDLGGHVVNSSLVRADVWGCCRWGLLPPRRLHNRPDLCGGRVELVTCNSLQDAPPPSDFLCSRDALRPHHPPHPPNPGPSTPTPPTSYPLPPTPLSIPPPLLLHTPARSSCPLST